MATQTTSAGTATSAGSVRPSERLVVLLRALRPKQWLKNAFVVAPALFGRELSDSAQIGRVAGAVACFCVISSALYLVNDVVDREQDRVHPEKRNRPVASGLISPAVALSLAAVLGVAALGGAALLRPAFGGVIAAYAILTLLYTFVLKYQVILDVMTISAGFVLRIVGGAVAVDVEPSVWILICTGLLALMLAFAKRRAEGLALDEDAVAHRRVLAHYSPVFVDAMIILAAGATITSYAVYTTTGSPSEHHLSGTLPFVLYGIFRYLWLVFHRDEGASPTAIAWSDRPLMVAVLLWFVAAGVLLAI